MVPEPPKPKRNTNAIQTIQEAKEERRARERAFFAEVKNRKIGKIKSKLYHRLKNRKKEKEKMRLLGELG